MKYPKRCTVIVLMLYTQVRGYGLASFKVCNSLIETRFLSSKLLNNKYNYDRVETKSRKRSCSIMMANPEATRGVMRGKDGDVNLEFQFFDEAQLYVRGGSGGQGACTFKVAAKKQRGQANGGSGGRGGNVVLECVGGLNTLGELRGVASFIADRGSDGSSHYNNGRDGSDVCVKVPGGTIVINMETGMKVGELQSPGERIIVARGGEGGKGNAAQKATRGTPPKASPSTSGEKFQLKLELKLVADVGLVGVPNAGKSTLLAAASNARPKIADYPFTTLVPNLGVCDPLALGFSGRGMVLADIPGLLEGAHRGVGLGLAFLRHVERCRLIIHVVSGASADPIGDFVAINQELSLFSKDLANKPQVVVLNKIDLPGVASIKSQLIEKIKEIANHTRIMEISAIRGDSVVELMQRTSSLLTAIEKEEELRTLKEKMANASRHIETENEAYTENMYDASIEKQRVRGELGTWTVTDGRLERLAQEMDWEYYAAEDRFIELMDALGVVSELRLAGADWGDKVTIGSRSVVLKQSQ